MKIVGSLCLKTFFPEKKHCASKEIKQKLRAMGEDIKNGLLRPEIESKNEIFTGGTSVGSLYDITPGHSLKDIFGRHSM